MAQIKFIPLKPDSQAVVMFTSDLPSQGPNITPLTVSEWAELTQWLNSENKTPADLIAPKIEDVLPDWDHPTITIDRLQALANRGFALALNIEKWTRAGLWVMTIEDDDYPHLIRDRLAGNAPTVIYGVGNRGLLNRHKQGIAFVKESEGLDESSQDFAKDIGVFCADINLVVGTSFQRQDKPHALNSALDNGGSVIGMVQNQLLSTALDPHWRSPLMSEQAVIISVNQPESGPDEGEPTDYMPLYALSSSITSIMGEQQFCEKSLPDYIGMSAALKQGWANVQAKEAGTYYADMSEIKRLINPPYLNEPYTSTSPAP